MTRFNSHKLVAFWGEGTQFDTPVRRNPSAEVAFKGRGRRLDGGTSSSRQEQTSTSAEAEANTSAAPPYAAGGVAFRGRGNRLGGR